MTRVPDFFLIGAPKSGTTTLHEVLQGHPSVVMADPKEPAFFSNDREYRLGLDYYLRTYFRSARGDELAIGEATPWYLYSELALERIRADLPETSHRFVCIVREPISRACSQYWDQYNLGREERGLHEAMQADLRQDGWTTPTEDHRSYLRCSRYEHYVPLFSEAFGPDRVLVLLQDDLRQQESRLRLYHQLFAFLGVPTETLTDRDVQANAGKAVRSQSIERIFGSAAGKEGPVRARISRNPAMRGRVRRWASRISRLNRVSVLNPEPPAELYEQLEGYFEPTIDFIEDAVGRTLQGWRDPSAPDAQR